MADLTLSEGVQAGAPASASLRQFVWVALALYLALSAYVLWRAAILRPYSDMFDYMVRYYQYRVDGDLWSYLFTPHNLHRLVWTFGLLALDVRLLGGTSWPLIASGALGVGVTAWALGRAAARAVPPSPVAFALGAGVAMLALMAGNVLDAATPLNAEYPQTTAFAVMALLLAEGRDERHVGWRGAGALACVAAAAFSSAVGLALWPALALGAVWRRDWPWLAIVLIVGAGFTALYLSGPHPPTDASGLLASARRPLGAIALMLDTLGLPWSRMSGRAGPLEGAAVLLLLVAAMLAGVRDTSARLARTLIVFSLVTTVMAGVGRSDIGQFAPVRYAMLMAPAHAGLAILAAPCIDRAWRLRPQVVGAATRGVLLLLLIQNLLMAAVAIHGSDRVRTLIADFDAGRRTPEMAAVIHWDLGHADDVSRRLRADRFFQTELHLQR